jgi:nitroimidazol reductase NimA-like FMN-containing flavoprotein (pyridoxamine 5'-phosphate oxidase superfamily)
MNDAWLEELSHDECLDLLRTHKVGRLAVVADDIPIVLPINYRLVETMNRTWLALRTRPENVLDQAPTAAAFEIDDINPFGQGGQSVLVRGQLDRIDADVAAFRERFDSEPWIVAERDAWLIIEPYTITGRRLHPASQDWAFHPQAYL